MTHETWHETHTETFADYISTKRADLDDVDPVQLALFLSCCEHAPRVASWFYDPAFGVVAKDWLLLRAGKNRAKLALVMRVGLLSDGAVPSWRMIGLALGVSGDRARQLAPKGLVYFWQEFGIVDGDIVGSVVANTPAAERVIHDLTVEDRIGERVALGPARSGLWDHNYDERTKLGMTTEDVASPATLCPWAFPPE